MPTTVTIVGAGGIGSHLLSTLVPAVHRGGTLRVSGRDSLQGPRLGHDWCGEPRASEASFPPRSGVQR